MGAHFPRKIEKWILRFIEERGPAKMKEIGKVLRSYLTKTDGRLPWKNYEASDLHMATSTLIQIAKFFTPLSWTLLLENNLVDPKVASIVQKTSIVHKLFNSKSLPSWGHSRNSYSWDLVEALYHEDDFILCCRLIGTWARKSIVEVDALGRFVFWLFACENPEAWVSLKNFKAQIPELMKTASIWSQQVVSLESLVEGRFVMLRCCFAYGKQAPYDHRLRINLPCVIRVSKVSTHDGSTPLPEHLRYPRAVVLCPEAIPRLKRMAEFIMTLKYDYGDEESKVTQNNFQVRDNGMVYTFRNLPDDKPSSTFEAISWNQLEKNIEYLLHRTSPTQRKKLVTWLMDLPRRHFHIRFQSRWHTRPILVTSDVRVSYWSWLERPWNGGLIHSKTILGLQQILIEIGNMIVAFIPIIWEYLAFATGPTPSQIESLVNVVVDRHETYSHSSDLLTLLDCSSYVEPISLGDNVRFFPPPAWIEEDELSDSESD